MHNQNHIADFLAQLGTLDIRLNLDGEHINLAGRTDLLTESLVNQIRENKAAIVEHLRALKAETIIEPVAAHWVDGVQWRETSCAQQRLWFLDRLEPGSSFYNMPLAMRLRGALNQEAVQAALDFVVRRHESLRTRFEMRDGRPMQVITQMARIGVVVIELDEDAKRPEQRDAAAWQIAQNEAAQPFDLQRGPLLRLKLASFDTDDHMILVTMHHIISDGWSMDVLMREFMQTYVLHGQVDPETLVTPLPVQYADYADWQHRRMKAGSLQRELAYWQTQLADAPALLTLPNDFARPRQQSHRGGDIRFDVDAEVLKALQQFGRQNGVTLFMALSGLFQVFLARYSGMDDVCIGAPVAGRDRPELQGLIGFFVNTVVLRARIDRSRTVRDCLLGAKRMVLDALAHQDVPFDQVVEAINPPRDPSYSPLFQVAFVLQQPSAQIQAGETQLHTLGNDTVTAKFDLTLSVIEHADRLACSFEYCSDLFETASISRMAQHFSNMLADAVRHPDRPIADLELLSAEEVSAHQRQLSNLPTVNEDALQQFLKQVAIRPDAPALIGAFGQYNYQELLGQAQTIRHQLQRHGVAAESVVAVFLDRSPEVVAAALAVMSLGAIYMPLDPAHPDARLAYMIGDAHPVLILTQGMTGDRYETRIAAELQQDRPIRVELTAFATPNESSGAEPCWPRWDPATAAYLIYTSGSTGRPKGSVLTHGGLANLVTAQCAAFQIGPERRVLQFAALGFDASISEMFCAVCSGAALCISDRDGLQPGASLVRTLTSLKVDVATLPPAALMAIDPNQVPQLSTLVVAGEACPLDVAQRWSVGRHFCNAYGPTECTVCATIAIAPNSGAASNRDYDPDGKSHAHCGEIGTPIGASIGTPMSGMRAYVLDSNLNWVAPGVGGELYLSGAGVGRGYLARADLTASQFLPDPFMANGERMYRTGDLVRQLADGRIVFMGRADRQIKLRGYRIDVPEIESVLCAIAGIVAAHVMVREDHPGDRRLCAYVVMNADATFNEAALRSQLQLTLPEYMVPGHLLAVPELPLTVNGKIDIAALPSPRSTANDLHHVAPSTDEERQVCALWADVLHAKRVGMDDNFFTVGGHSLLAARLLNRVLSEFGTEISLRTFFAQPTVRGLLEAIKQTRPATGGVLSGLAPRDQKLPLSYAQERLWFLQQLDGSGSTYNMPTALRIRGDLDVPALESALNALIERHEILRTQFVNDEGVPRMVIVPAVTVRLERECVDGDTGPSLTDIMRQHAQFPFVLEQAPLLAVRVLQTAAQESVLLINLHHIICDGWSMGILANEWMTLYYGALTSRQGESVLPPLQCQYADYAWYQRMADGQRDMERQLGYWVNQLANAPELLNLPTDRPRPPTQRFEGAVEVLALTPELSSSLKQFAAEVGTTPFVALLAAFAVLMARYSGESDILIGTPAANRNRQELESLIGLFLGNLVLRADLSDRPSYRKLVTRLKETVLDAFAHGDVPFERIVDALPIRRDLSRNPLFQVFFNMLNQPQASVEVPGLDITPMTDTQVEAKFDLTMYVQDSGEQLHLSLVYNRVLFDAVRIQEMLRQYAQWLMFALADPEASIDRPSLLTPYARAQLPDPNASLGQEWLGAVHQRFVAKQQAQPDALAIVSHERTWTYRELHLASERIACYLQAQGVQRGDIVAICAARNATIVAAVIGVLKSGAAFMMLDPTYPAEHLQACLEATTPFAWLQVSDAPLSLEKQALVEQIPHVLDLTDIDQQSTLLAFDGATATNIAITADDLALIAFTSGSTGKPKAVEGRHGPLTHFLPWLEESFQLDQRDRYSMLSGLAHDPLQRDMFTTLCLGACLHIPHPDVIRPGELARWVAEQGVTITHLTPAMAQILAEAEPGASLPDLRMVFLVGDILTRRDVQRLQSLAPSVSVVNYYGSTETQRSVSYYEVRKETAEQAQREVIPLGRGIRDVQLLVLNTLGEQTGIGEMGEVYVRSFHMARGYRGDPAYSAQRFLKNPFGSDPCDRVYRTGDLGRYLPNGMVECLGRADTQVKLRGFRVELGHIESLLGQHEQVREAIVVIRGERAEDKRLIAFVVPQHGQVDVAALREYLRTKLPDYMLPSAYVTLDTLPLTPNGKVNRSALRAPDIGADEQSYLAPRNPVEAEMVAIWSELLQVPRVGVLDDFFEMGGNSLLAVRLMARIHKAFGQRLPVSQIFITPTVASLSNALESNRAPVSLLVPLRSEGAHAPLVLIHPADGGVFHYTELVEALAPVRPVFGLQSVDTADQTLEPYTLETVAQRYADEIEQRFAGAAVHLGGWSLGGTIAVKVAEVLQTRGQPVLSVHLFDTAYRGDTVREPFLLEGFIESTLSRGEDEVIVRFGAQHAELHARIKQLASAIGVSALAERMQHESEALEAETGFDRSLQQLIIRMHEQMNRNIQLANRFSPAVLDAPIHTYWADDTLDDGVNPQCWQAYTQVAARSACHRIGGRHGDFVMGDNVRAIAVLLDRNLDADGQPLVTSAIEQQATEDAL